MGRGFLGDSGRGSAEGLGAGVGTGLLALGAIGGGFAAGFGTTAGLSSFGTVCASCSCLSL